MRLIDCKHFAMNLLKMLKTVVLHEHSRINVPENTNTKSKKNVSNAKHWDRSLLKLKIVLFMHFINSDLLNY